MEEPNRFRQIRERICSHCLFLSLAESHPGALFASFSTVSFTSFYRSTFYLPLSLCRHPLLLLHLLFIPYSLIRTRERMRSAPGLITPSKKTRRELRLRNSVRPDFWDSWPRETHRDLPRYLDCSWITDISNGRWWNHSIRTVYRNEYADAWWMNHIEQCRTFQHSYFFRFRIIFWLNIVHFWLPILNIA